MNIRKMLFIAGLMLAFTTLLPVAHADDWNQARVTFSQSVQVPGHVLPAGTYWFQLSDTNDRHYLVQILREDRTLVATVFAIPRKRQGINPKVAITLADRGNTQPEAIVALVYVGQIEGHEFL